MFAAILGFIVGKKWLLIGGAFALLIVGSAITIGVIMMQRDRARADAAQYLADAAIYQAAAQRNAQTIRIYQGFNERVNEQSAAEIEAAHTATANMADIAARIIHATGPNSDCGPRVGIWLDSVRREQAPSR